MTRLHRLLLLLPPLLLGLGTAAMPGRAQQAPAGRYAFADTTLLRDTLGLSFQGLHPLADSLGLRPDTLRALSIRYRYSLARMVELSDSLGVPVDSVGVLLFRERFNPLAAGPRRRNSFSYNSTYQINQDNTTWISGSDFLVGAGPVIIAGSSTVQIDRRVVGGRPSLDETRTVNARADRRFSRSFSIGGVADLSRVDNRARGSLYNQSIKSDQYQLSVRSLQQPMRGMNSEINFSGGLLDVVGSGEEKRGLTGNLNGRVRYARANWFTHDLSGQVTGNLANTKLPSAVDHTRTHDFSGNLRGTLGVLSSGPVAFNANYSLREARIETPIEPRAIAPGDTTTIQQVESGSQSIDMALRLRRDNNRYLNVAQRFGNARQASATTPNSQNSRNDQGLNLSGRYGIGPISLDGGFNRTLSTTKYPKRGGANGGYGEDLDSRAVDGTLSWSVSPRLTAKAVGNVSLTRSRYFILGSYPNPPVPRDLYRQSYRLDGVYTHSQRFNTGLGLEVSRSLFVNLPAASTAANNENRGYRADWRWTFRLLPGLTATQRNQLNADYIYYTFLESSANRLSLDYFTSTTLNAVITPRLQLDVSHDYRYQPTGGFAPLDGAEDDGNSYFSQADDSRNSLLRVGLNYSPSQAFSISIRPEFISFERNTVAEGVSSPQRSSRTLNLSGGANLNLPVGRRGTLTGGIARTYRADRTINYVSGAPDNRPRSEYDYWNGSLQFSWSL